MRALILLSLILLISGCAAPVFDKEAAILDACCIDPIPKNWQQQAFNKTLRFQSVTFCTVR